MEHHAVLYLALFIVLAKFAVAGCKVIRIPPVVGLIALGLVAGKSGLNVVHEKDALLGIATFADIGVVILLFLAGLETDLSQLRKTGRTSTLIAIGGVFVPLAMGLGLVYAFYQDFERAILVGSVLTATSVSISVITFSDMNKFSSVESKTVVTSAIIDDVIAIVLLSIVLGFIGGGTESKSVTETLISIVAFFAGAGCIGLFVVPFLLQVAEKSKVKNMITSVALGMALIFAWAAHAVDLASITGAYLCGVCICRTKQKHTVVRDTETIGNALFIPLFFVYIGMNTVLHKVQFDVWFLILFVVVGIGSKILGSGVMARSAGFDWRRSFIIGTGMVPRGEVALVIAALASSPQMGGVLTPMDNASVIVLVLATAFATPFLLKWGFSMGPETKKGGDDA